MAESDDFWDLLAEWEEAHRQGREVAPEELCRDRPELLEQPKDHIDALKRMDWLFKGDDEAEKIEPEPILQPFNIGEYTVLERIGSGGMGAVYKALHRRMDRIVALKILPHLSPEAVQRFEQEAKAAAKLSHGNIVAAYDAGESDGKLYLAMELVDGVDFFRVVEEQGPIPTEKAVNYILQAAMGLAFAHGQGITHMDVTPGNLLLGKDGTVKVLDLGLARFKRQQDGPSSIAGTVDFMAPELSQGGQADHRSDIYSLGCCLYFLVTGKPVFSDETRPYKPGENPLQARFPTYLQYAVNNIRQGKVPRVARVDRPAGMFSIAVGRTRPGERGGGVSPDSLVAGRSGESDVRELIEDIEARLRPREHAYGLPLVDLFRKMLAGERVRVGGKAAKMGKQVIARTIEDYAHETGNYQLLWLLLQHNGPKPPRQKKGKPTAKEKDYASILAVVDRFGRPIGTSELGKYRRRWLEYPPRNPHSGHRNRLEEVLSQMVQDGVLKAVRGHAGGVRYARPEEPALPSA